jgi:hypothetical protein
VTIWKPEMQIPEPFNFWTYCVRFSNTILPYYLQIWFSNGPLSFLKHLYMQKTHKMFFFWKKVSSVNLLKTIYKCLVSDYYGIYFALTIPKLDQDSSC